MKITTDKQREIVEKTKTLKNATEQLKKEFVGIDDIIDQLANSIKPYYFFSESLKRPLVVNLWGLTGTGKTSIIDKLVSLLELSDKYFKFDCGEYIQHDYRLKHSLERKLSGCDESNQILVFDEFQLCRTIDETGKEIDRGGTRPLWELLDSGKLVISDDDSADVSDIYKKAKEVLKANIKVNNGIVDDIDERRFTSIVTKNVYLNVEDYMTNTLDEEKRRTGWFTSSDQFGGKGRYCVPLHWTEVLYRANPDFFNQLYIARTIPSCTGLAIRNYLVQMDIEKLIEFIREKFLRKEKAQVSLDLSKSVIFCIGNLDEAYAMAHTVSPDSDADLFHQHSLKISVPKIKNALSRRFRMEQIGRLGNNHIIYPSLSRQNYVDIIKLYLQQRVDGFKKEYDIQLEFTQNVEDILYKEAVFPTQGVRPVLSTMTNQIDSYVSKMLLDIMIDSNYNENVDWIVWDYNKRKTSYVIHVYTGEKEIMTKEYKITLYVEKFRQSDKSEEQALIAVHEAGHAIAAIFEAGILPKDIVTRTADPNAGGYCTIEFPDLMTRDSLLKEVVVLYGGIEAERLIFGPDFTSVGADSDFKRATKHLFKYFKSYGMHDVNLKISAIVDETETGAAMVLDDSYEEKIIELSKTLKERTRTILVNHRKELLQLAEVLSRKSKLTAKEIVKTIDLSNVEFKNKENYYHFKEQIGVQLSKESLMSIAKSA